MGTTNPPSPFTHLRADGRPGLVDVSAKTPTVREAVARGVIELPPAMARHWQNGEPHSPKGPIFQTAILAGTMAAKRTSDLIPLCHPLPLDACTVRVRATSRRRIVVEAQVRTTQKTGVEMEALTAVAVAALTIYDMCKAVSQGIVIRDIRLVKKTGGKTDYVATA